MRCELHDLTPVMGSEARGVDLAQLDDATAGWVKAALAARKVLVFRDQHLDNEAHKRVARLFGSGVIHVHHLIRGKTADDEITPVNHDANSAFNIGDGWHSDASCDPTPIAASALYMKQMPPGGGGDTLFADMHECWRRLSDPMKTLFGGLTAFHDGGKGYGEDYGISAEATGRAYNRTEHPIIVAHPVTGEQLLYVNTGFTTKIHGLAPHESRALLDMLFRHIDLTVTAHVRVRWAENTLVLWDNVATQHQAIWDYYPETRRANRVSVIGPEVRAA